MGAGRCTTYPRVVELLKKAVEEIGQRGTARATGVAQQAIHRFLKGNSEPSQATLEKLADYFNVSVGWLRGDDSDTQALSYEELSNILCTRGLGVPLEVAYRITKEVMEVFTKSGTVLPEVGTKERLDYIDKIKHFVKRECGIFLSVHRNDGEDIHREAKNIIKTADSSLQKAKSDYHIKVLLNELKEFIESQTVNASAEERKKFVADLIEQLSLTCQNIDTKEPNSE